MDKYVVVSLVDGSVSRLRGYAYGEGVFLVVEKPNWDRCLIPAKKVVGVEVYTGRPCGWRDSDG